MERVIKENANQSLFWLGHFELDWVWLLEFCWFFAVTVLLLFWFLLLGEAIGDWRFGAVLVSLDVRFVLFGLLGTWVGCDSTCADVGVGGQLRRILSICTDVRSRRLVGGCWVIGRSSQTWFFVHALLQVCDHSLFILKFLLHFLELVLQILYPIFLLLSVILQLFLLSLQSRLILLQFFDLLLLILDDLSSFRQFLLLA